MALSPELYMFRCLELAALASGYTASNPMVGAVLVCHDRIIGEGYHHHYGGPHAEVVCINSVSETDKHLIAKSELYVSLEPCAHHGKTPPCADLIIRNGIPKVIIGCRDPFKEVDGKGIEKLNAAGIETVVGMLEAECIALNKRFFTFHTFHRPYIILKWAQTSNHKISSSSNKRLFITGSDTNFLVHKWRSAESAVMVGTNTAAMDDPQLTNRRWSGPSPTRIVIDKKLRLSPTLHIFDSTANTIVFNFIKQEQQGNTLYYRLTGTGSLVNQITQALYALNSISVLIEGGGQLLQSFIDEGCWDEARVITNPFLTLPDGVSSPILVNEKLIKEEQISDDDLSYYIRK